MTFKAHLVTSIGRRRRLYAAATAALCAAFASVPTVHADDTVNFSIGAVTDSQTMVLTDAVPCPVGVAEGACAAVVTATVIPDVSLPPCNQPVNTCAPSNAKYYRITIGFTQNHCYGTGYSYGCYEEYTDQMQSEDWYNGSSSGNVWVGLSCSNPNDYNCGTASKGAFWDSGRGASTDWGNQSMIATAHCCVDNQTVYLRTYVTPSGGVSFYSGF